MALATKASWKAIARFAAMLGNGFNSSKCKTVAKLATSRIKLLRNKRDLLVKQMRRDVAMLLESGQEATARIRVEHAIREQNIMAANEIIELFCELVVVRLPIIAKQRTCPADLKEGISSLMFAAPRCSDIPELQQLRKIFQKKYGKDFVTAAMDLHPDCGVNRTLIEKLSVRTPSGDVKLKIMKEIAKEYKIDWDTKDTEQELLKPPEERLEGANGFVSATSMPVKTASQIPNQASTRFYEDMGEKSTMQFKDSTSAAEAAAVSARKAIAAAGAAAALVKQYSNMYQTVNNSANPVVMGHCFPSDDNPQVDVNAQSCHSDVLRQMLKSQSINTARSISNEKMFEDKEFRRHSSSMPRAQSDIRFDDSDGLDSSDCDEEIEMETPCDAANFPPRRPPPNIPDVRRSDTSDSSSQNSGSRIHPKLPDYDELSARFEALKHRRT